ncbi:hypothetical protein Tco_0726503 [Tanacetum coccineum]|uniref:Uncharacterized protein n=1 Tax=Tanacetum coccineum TaxID=301880 RepID=A0ABQ4YGN4_9ASTR
MKPSQSLDLVQDSTHLQVIRFQLIIVTQIVLTSWRHPWDTNTTTFPKILSISTHSGPSPTAHTSAVWNTVGKGKEKSQENPNEPASDAPLRQFCDKNYNQLLPILAEKMHQEKVQQEKLKAVKARLNFEEISQYSESGAPGRRRDVRKRLGPKDVRIMSGSPEPRRDRSRSPRRKDPERETVFRRLEKGVFHRLGNKEKGGRMSESEDSAGGHWKSKSKRQKSSVKDEDLSQPWVCEETDPFTQDMTPTTRTEPKRWHENKRSRSPTPVASVFKRLKQNRPPSPRPKPRKEGGVFNRLGGKEQSASAHSDSRHQGSHEKEIEVQPRKHHHRGTSSRETGGYSESEDSKGGH